MRADHGLTEHDALGYEAAHAEPTTRLVHGYPVDESPADCVYEPRHISAADVRALKEQLRAAAERRR